VSEWVAQEAHKQGFNQTTEVVSLSAEEANRVAKFGSALWGANSRAKAKRARVVLKWEPNAPALKDTIKDTVVEQARVLGVRPGHAKVAAGEA
jgi:hypothetical protein